MIAKQGTNFFNLGSSAITLGLAIASAVYLTLIATPVSMTDPKSFVAPPALLKHFTFGYKENFSDSLWIRVIQDIGFCEKLPDQEIASNSEQQNVCNKGWVFQMLDAITELTPKFRTVYSMGATSLSVLVEDKLGAAELFEKGIANFPNDWPILYKSAYHYLVEMNDPVRAADLLVRAGNNGAPPWVFSLAGKLYTSQGRAMVAKVVLEEALEQHSDSPYALRLKSRLEAVNQVIYSNDTRQIYKPLSDTFQDTKSDSKNLDR